MQELYYFSFLFLLQTSRWTVLYFHLYNGPSAQLGQVVTTIMLYSVHAFTQGPEKHLNIRRIFRKWGPTFCRRFPAAEPPSTTGFCDGFGPVFVDGPGSQENSFMCNSSKARRRADFDASRLESGRNPARKPDFRHGSSIP